MNSKSYLIFNKPNCQNQVKNLERCNFSMKNSLNIKIKIRKDIFHVVYYE